MKYLITIGLLSLKNKIRTLQFKDNFKIALFLYISAALAIFIYFLSYRFILHLNTIAVAGPLIVNKFISLVCITAFIMVLFSSVLVSLSTIYFGKDIKWLISAPIKIHSIFLYKSLISLVYSAWMVIVVIIPFLLAFGYVKNANAPYYIFSFIILIPFLSSSGFLGTSISVIIMKFFPSAETRNIMFIIAVVFFTVLLIFVRLVQPEKFVSSTGFEHLSQYLGYLDAPTAKFLPSWWFTSALFGLISLNTKAVILNFIYIISVFILSFAILIYTGKKYFLDGLSSKISFANTRLSKYVYKYQTPFYSIFLKDIKVFFRDSTQWSQILLLFSLLVVYLFSIYKVSADLSSIRNFMIIANCSLIWFIISAVALRLSFPLISIESESLWFILSIPYGRIKILFEKLLIGSVPVIAVSCLLIIISNIMLKTDAAIFIFSFIMTIFISFSICASAVFLGTIFPKFNYSSIPEIESSFGGLVFMISSMFLIIINTVLITVPIKAYYSDKYNLNIFFKYGIYILLLNIIVMAVLFIYTRKNLTEMEK